MHAVVTTPNGAIRSELFFIPQAFGWSVLCLSGGRTSAASRTSPLSTAALLPSRGYAKCGPRIIRRILGTVLGRIGFWIGHRGASAKWGVTNYRLTPVSHPFLGAGTVYSS